MASYLSPLFHSFLQWCNLDVSQGMQSYLKVLLRELSSSSFVVVAEFISVCALGLRASVLPCWLEAALSSLP